ncbi:MAG TPA: hypothetical protein V6D47_18450 [Oscillatoriaceae cyanobacterium]
MILTYDVVAGELELDREDGSEPLTFKTAQVQAKLYTDHGLLSCVVDGTEIELAFVSPEDEPTALETKLVPIKRWRVGFRAL